MKIIKPDFEIDDEGLGQYHPVTYEDGRITCSCGNELVKLDDDLYRCSAGWPMYRFSQGDIIKDKFGNLLLRSRSHERGEE